MSGPKVSVYELTAEQRAAIAAELRRQMQEREEHKRLEGEISKISKNFAKISSAIKEFDYIADELVSRLDDKMMKCAMVQLRGEIEAQSKVMSRNVHTSSNSELAERLESSSVMMQEFQARLSEIKSMSDRAVNKLQTALNEDVSALFETTIRSGSVAEECNSKGSILVDEIKESLENEVVPMSLRRDADTVIARYDKITGSKDVFIAIELMPIVERCRSFNNLWERCGEDYLSLYRSYECLVENNGTHDMKIFPFSEESIVQLKKEIAIESEKARIVAEQKYIAEALNETMEEMGYSLLAHREVTKRNGSHFSGKLFDYNDGSAINVTYSDNGQIAMEIGKIGMDDRLPSMDESEKMESQMREFCNDFKRIENRLLEKGVFVGNRIILSPPSSEYAQIINVNDFEMIQKDNIHNSDKRKRVVASKTKAIDKEN